MCEVYVPAWVPNSAPCSNADADMFFKDGKAIGSSRAIKDTVVVTWTSTRMKIRGLQRFQYGRIEAPIK